jgi:hypothetical protein
MFHSESGMNMLKSGHITLALLILALSHTSSAASIADRFTPEASYYFDHFDPGQKPWEPGQYLNIEEVFKNYQYFEIVFDRDGKGITVYRYVRGSKEGSENYLVLPDQSLQQK